MAGDYDMMTRARATVLYRDSGTNLTIPSAADFVDAEVIKAKLDEILEGNARIEGRLEAIQAALDILTEE